MDTIYIEKEIEGHPRAAGIISQFPKAEKIYCNRYTEVFNPKSQNFRLQKLNPALILAKKHEGHVLPTPEGYGVGGEFNFYFSHMLNCVYDCRYCFLQGMYSSAHFVVFINYEDFTDSVIKTFELSGGEPWFFSGYDCDSLAFEPVTGFIEHCLDVFAKMPRCWLEIRTKSTQIRSLMKRDALDNVVVAFSFTPGDFSTRFENKVPDVDKRIKAMQSLQSGGWKIGLRFDPMIAYQGYQNSYQALFEAIFSKLDRELIHSVSMGEFRMPKGFYKTIKKLYPGDPLYHLPMDETSGVTTINDCQRRSMFDFCEQQLLRWLPESKLYTCSI